MRFRGSSSAALPPPVSGLPSPVSGLPPPCSLPATRYSLLLQPPSPSSLLPSPGRGRSRARGFTLVELLIGATLSAAVLAAVLSSYLYLSRQLARLAHQQTLETQARTTLGTFTQDAQRATGVTVTPQTAPDFYVTFALPTDAAGVTQAIYFYSRSGTTTSISGNNVTIAANTLVRVASTGSAIVGQPQTILRYTLATDEGCAMRFYDASGNPYDSGVAPYTPLTTNYWPGVKQVSLQFATQTGVAASGTQTPVHRGHTGRLALRNRGFLQ